MLWKQTIETKIYKLSAELGNWNMLMKKKTIQANF